MKIQGKEKLQTEKGLTIKDLHQGDVFIFLAGDYTSTPLMVTDYDDVVALTHGYMLDRYDYLDIPVKRINCCLVIEDQGVLK